MNKESGNKPNNESIHLKYIIFILALVIVLISAYKFYAIDNLANYINFAASLISIVLGVTAIIYSFVSNTSVYNSIFKIDEASNGITQTSEELKQSSIELSSKIDELNTVLKSIEEKTNRNTAMMEKIASNKEDADSINK